MIRAFKSTLEDMEEKRSIHSLSLRSAALAQAAADARRTQRPAASSAGGVGASEICYIDDDAAAAAADKSNGLSRSGRMALRHTALAAAEHGGQYLKVEGQTYRVQRVVQQQQPETASAMLPVPQDRIRRCSDAQAQTNESSFEALTQPPPHHSHPLTITTASSALSAPTNNCDALADPPSSSQPRVQVGPVGHVLPHPQSAVPPSASSSRNPSPVPPPPQPPAAVPMFVSVPAPPSPVPAALQVAYGYDPSYCQYLGQAADGFQYELVRRPSLGNPLANSELAVPPLNNHVLRRPSTGSPYPSPRSPHHLHGSFDSCAAEAGTMPVPSPSTVAAAAGPPLLFAPSPAVVPTSHSPYHYASSSHLLYHPQPAVTAAATAAAAAAQPVLFTQQPPFQPASYQAYRHHSVSSTSGAAASSAAPAPGYHSSGGGGGVQRARLTPPGPGLPGAAAGGHMQSAFRMVGDHVEATSGSASELAMMPKMIHETSI